mmetsp:Transcript_6201/g.9011  ORF Transcript_6201/g.9011 Transcript_6201/m.9011 type:complete len:868 (+) Transcript_6201:60-2663(+)
MGIPSFFKWTQQKYPEILENLVEDGNNKRKLDNLYLDMNGIVHPCVAQVTEFNDICNYLFKVLDRMIELVNPQKMIYFAFDGVAPRAKMNQQRGRRFVAAKTQEQRENIIKDLKKIAEEKDIKITEKLIEGEMFDSNQISPGTPFMRKLAEAMRYYIQIRLQAQKKWKKLTIYFSDTDQPGEGEHKILDYMRQERLNTNYDPNQTHVVYGLDADLFLLTLTLHDPHVYILREAVKGKSSKNEILKKEFKLASIAKFREGIAKELVMPNRVHQPSFERMYMDFIFICSLIGNDFLPSLPLFKIANGGLDVMIQAYKLYLQRTNNAYLINEKGQIEMTNFLTVFMQQLADIERQQYMHGQLQDAFLYVNEKNLKALQLDSSPHIKKNKKKEKKSSESSFKGTGQALSTNKAETLSREELANRAEQRLANKKPTPNVSSSLFKDAANPLSLRKKYPVNQQVYISNVQLKSGDMLLSPETVRSAIYEQLKEHGTILHILLLTYAFSSDAKASAFVIFSSEAEQRAAVKKKKMTLYSRECRILNAQVDETDGSPQFDDQFVSELNYRLSDIDFIAMKNHQDVIHYGKEDWKTRYVAHIFGQDISVEQTMKSWIIDYLVGLQFVMRYYLTGLPSWIYYYPHNYAPPASEMARYGASCIPQLIEKMASAFSSAEDKIPYAPMVQLLCILPLSSAKKVLPEKVYQRIVNLKHVESYYPSSFYIDFHNCKASYHGHPHLPFINVNALCQDIGTDVISMDDYKNFSFYVERFEFDASISNTKAIEPPTFLNSFSATRFSTSSVVASRRDLAGSSADAFMKQPILSLHPSFSSTDAIFFSLDFKMGYRKKYHPKLMKASSFDSFYSELQELVNKYSSS